MARAKGKLTFSKIEALIRGKHQGVVGDGNGLYLQFDGGAISWIYRYSFGGKRPEKGLGAYRDVSLDDARIAVITLGKMRRAGIDPMTVGASEPGAVKTFEDCALGYVETHEATWSRKHAQQTRHALSVHAKPLHAVPVAELTTEHVLGALKVLWTTRNPTAKRLQNRIECVLDWAKAKGYRQGENPARWRGHLQQLLAAPAKLHQVRHFAALPYDQIPVLMAKLQTRDEVAAGALELLILCAVRTEAIAGLAAEGVSGAKWSEFNIGQRVWSIPQARMKGERGARAGLRVPLSPAALEVLNRVRRLEGSPFVFPGRFDDAGLSEGEMRDLLKDLGYGADVATVHGMRSSFDDWATAQGFQRLLIEKALGHAKREDGRINKVVDAYQRGDLLDQRRKMMDVWGRHCTAGAGSKVIPFVA
ncbi:MAG: tyrosine-type recombinase/integrase [Xanthobacteraceae bacterium]